MKRLGPSTSWRLAAAALVSASAGVAAAQEPASESAASYCARDLGAWFYCHRQAAPSPAAPPDAAQPADAGPSESDELARFEAFRAELDRAGKLAVWAPTPANVERYHRLQQKALNQSSLFSDAYRRLVWANPQLDYALKRPVSELGKRDWVETRTADRELFLKKVSGEVGLFYVFRGNCSPCRVFAPIIRTFAERYALTVRGVSLDGSPSAAVPTAFVDQGQLRSWGIESPATPSILLFQASSLQADTGTVRRHTVRLSDERVVDVAPCLKPRGCLSYIGAGVMSQEDLLERIYVTLATRPGEDY